MNNAYWLLMNKDTEPLVAADALGALADRRMVDATKTAAIVERAESILAEPKGQVAACDALIALLTHLPDWDTTRRPRLLKQALLHAQMRTQWPLRSPGGDNDPGQLDRLCRAINATAALAKEIGWSQADFAVLLALLRQNDRNGDSLAVANCALQVLAAIPEGLTANYFDSNSRSSAEDGSITRLLRAAYRKQEMRAIL